MSEDNTTEASDAPETPAVPPPPSGTHKPPAAPPPAPKAPEPAPPPPAPEPTKAPEPPPAPPAPGPDPLEAIRAELAELRGQLSARAAEELQAARAELAKRFGGGLIRPEYAALMPQEDPRTEEGARKLTEWLAAHPELVRQPPPPPAPEPSKEHAEQARLFGRPLPTAAAWAKLEVVQ